MLLCRAAQSGPWIQRKLERIRVYTDKCCKKELLVTFPLLPSNDALFPRILLIMQFAMTCKYQQWSEVITALFQVLGVAGPARVFLVRFLLKQGSLLSEEQAFRKAVASVCHSWKDEQIPIWKGK